MKRKRSPRVAFVVRLQVRMARKSLAQKKISKRRQLKMELLEQRCMLASDWQNPLWNLDVDDDGTLSPLDALVIINKINAADPNLDLRQPVGNNPYLDVDADLTLSPLDVLQIINRINLGQTSVQVDVFSTN